MLDHIPADESRMPGCPAPGEDDPPRRQNSRHDFAEPAQVGAPIALEEPAAKGVVDCIGLLVDLFQHEMGITAPFDRFQLEIKLRDILIDFNVVVILDHEAVCRDDGHLAV